MMTHYDFNPKFNKPVKILNSSQLETMLGTMVVAADENRLYFLQFADQIDWLFQKKWLCQHTQATIIEGITEPMQSIQAELDAYFCSRLKIFTTPVCWLGTPFQQAAWQALQTIPYGATKSYQQQAQMVGKPSAYRAVANANGANRFTIVVPCHRVIRHNGDLGGYGGGINRKQWLLQHEQKSRH